jgi:hypothetical protein
MATVAQVAKASLQALLVQASEAPLEADEYQDFIFAMNNYMTSLAANGVNLGYTAVTDIGDEVTVPQGAIHGIIANMAIVIAPQFGAVVPQGVAMSASEGMKAMRKLGQFITPTRRPSILPRGSGNESFGRTSHFYPDAEQEVLAEATGAIGLEVSTNG